MLLICAHHAEGQPWRMKKVVKSATLADIQSVRYECIRIVSPNIFGNIRSKHSDKLVFDVLTIQSSGFSIDKLGLYR